MRNYPQNLSRMITTWNCCDEIRCGPYIITYSFDIGYLWPLWICLFLQMKKSPKWFFGTEPWKSTFLHISFKKYKQLRIFRLLSLVCININFIIGVAYYISEVTVVLQPRSRLLKQKFDISVFILALLYSVKW